VDDKESGAADGKIPHPALAEIAAPQFASGRRAAPKGLADGDDGADGPPAKTAAVHRQPKGDALTRDRKRGELTYRPVPGDVPAGIVGLNGGAITRDVAELGEAQRKRHQKPAVLEQP